MIERCLMAACWLLWCAIPMLPLSVLDPYQKTTASLKREKPSRGKKQPSQPTNKNDIRANSSLSRSSVSFNITSSPPKLPPTRRGRDAYLVSNLVEEESSFGVVETIFKSGWDNKIGLKIEKVLKINHNVDVLNTFEEYREIVKSKSSNIPAGETMRIERLAADGNEVLRFHGAIVTCSLGNDEFSSICHRECCGICKMVGSSLSNGEESVPLSNNSRQAHRKVVTECDVNNCARKAIVICRVIAGRVAQYRGGLVDGQEGGFDSVVNLSKDQLEGSEELIILNARAVLPCFVIVYNVKGDDKM